MNNNMCKYEKSCGHEICNDLDCLDFESKTFNKKSKSPSPDVVGDNQMTMQDILDGLQYIIDLLPQERDGFNPQTIRVAREAKQFIINQHQQIRNWTENVL